ncbi:hypothetical protein HDU67_010352 [Dinochytrium kinnereticum]|nr:hypothetical protein HDU67_010352 [Dinochytrium kinnereticum]
MEADSRSLTAFTARFVKETFVNERKRQQLIDCLQIGEPYIEKDVLAVAMIDISGFSALTSNLAKEGKISSELITQTVGAYMNKIIDVLSTYEGDIVKFLGDAVLVTFSKSQCDENISRVTERATLCCAHILSQYPYIEVDTSAYINMGEMSENVLPRSQSHASRGRDNDPLVKGTSRSKKDGSGQTTLYSLRLHTAVSVGETSRVVLGRPSSRLDYFIYGDHLNELGVILEHSKQGELGVSNAVWELCEFPIKKYLPVSSVRKYSGFCVLNGTVLQKVFASRKMSTTLSVHSPNLESEMFIMRFINQSFIFKIRPDIFDAAMQKIIEETPQPSPLARKKSSFHSMAMTNSRKASISRASATVIESEFRTLSTMFIKLLWGFNAVWATACMDVVLEALDKYCGVFQQFSVDDKGQTILAFFGLPPWNRENNSAFAIRAAIDVLAAISLFEYGPISISVATGEVLVSFIGNDIWPEFHRMRRGNTSEITASGIPQSPGYEGRRQYAERIWLISPSVQSEKSATKVNEAIDEENPLFGYQLEMEAILNGLKFWHEYSEQFVGVLEGPSGIGKTKMASIIKREARKLSLPICFISGSEVDQGTPFFGIKPVIAYILEANQRNESKINRRGQVIRSLSSLSKFSMHSKETAGGESERNGSITTKVSSARRETVSVEEIEHNIKTFIRLGIPAELASLFRQVIPSLQIPDSDRVKRLDAQARVSILKSILLNCFQRFSSKPGVEGKLVLIIDDIQWIDATSMDIFISIAKTCRNTFLLLLRASKGRFYTIYGKLKTTIPYFATLTELEFESWKMKETQGSQLSPKILERIFEVSSGNPFFIDVLMDDMLSKIGYDLSPKSVSERTSILAFDVDTIDLKNMTSMILVQFDRLDGSFKDFLRLAAVFGQQFALEDLIFAFDLSESAEELAIWIDISDRFRFLNYNTTMIGTGEGMDSSFDLDRRMYTFRNIAIMTSIYESQPYSYRQSTHGLIGRKFETILAEENRDVVLPLLVFHFTKSTEHEKSIQYLQELGSLYSERFILDSCLQTTELLLSVASKNLPDMSEENCTYHHKLQRARWLCVLTNAHFLKKNLKNAWSTAMSTLSLLGDEPWPQEKKDFKAKLVRELGYHFRLWTVTAGGRREHKATRRRVGSMNDFSINGPTLLPPQRLFLNEACAASFETDRIKATCYNLLRESAYWDFTRSDEDQFLSLLKCLNVCIRYAKDSPAAFANLCVRSSLAFRSRFPFLQRIYSRREKELISNLHPVMVSKLEILEMVRCICDYHDGKAQESLKHVLRYIENRKSDGDIGNHYMGLCMREHILFWIGVPRTTETEELIAVFSEVFRQEIIVGVVAGTILISREMLLRAEFEKAEIWLKTCQAFRIYMPGIISQTSYRLSELLAILLRPSDTSSGLKMFIEIVEVLKNVNTIFPTPIDGIVLLSFYPLFILFPPLNSGIPLKSPKSELSRLDRIKLMNSVSALRDCNKRMSMVQRVSLCEWAFQIGTVMMAYLEHGEAGARRAYIKVKRAMGRHASVLKNYLMLRAWMLAAIGLLRGGRSASENQVLLMECVELFNKIGYIALSAWIQTYM